MKNIKINKETKEFVSKIMRKLVVSNTKDYKKMKQVKYIQYM